MSVSERENKATAAACDLHCDLLSYLAAREGRDLYNEESRCALPQLKRGGVSFQALAIFCETKKGSTHSGLKQLAAFQAFCPSFAKEGIKVALALENASTFAEEGESLEEVFLRFERFQKVAAPLYVSLTWNTENRFGGGNASSIGLKRDGEALLTYLSGQGIAIDLSHTSDALAIDVMEFIDKKALKLKLLASHSNFRKVRDHKRNLPCDIASEIIRRKGLVGINLFRAFVGDKFSTNLIEMIEHGLCLGGENALCFGADFFCDTDFSTALSYTPPFFHEAFSNASCYPKIQHLLTPYFPSEIIEKIFYANVLSFLRK